jgi:hypothetical protein
MKTLPFKVLLFSVFLLPLFGNSAPLVQDCMSIAGNNHHLLLFVTDGEIKQVRMVTSGSLPHVLIVNKLANQVIEGSTLYTLGNAGLMTVENKVLAGEIGTLRLAGETFSCMQN